MKPTTDDILENLNLLLTDDRFVMSVLANASAWLYEKVNNLNWLGFYVFHNNNLYLGPFQGKVACNYIEMGRGVCGKSAQTKSTIVVSDVSFFPGYIACDSESKSEIVVPLIVNDQLYGVLDVDSPLLNRFSDCDVVLFEKAAKIISEHLAKII